MIDALHFLKIFYENFLQLRLWPLIISIRMITMIRCKDGDARERKIAAFLVRELSRSVESSSWDRQREETSWRTSLRGLGFECPFGIWLRDRCERGSSFRDFAIFCKYK